MAAVYYNIAKVSPNDFVLSNKIIEIINTINAERARRGLGSSGISYPTTANTITAQYINTIGAQVQNWTGANYSVASGNLINASNINAIIDGIIAAGLDPLTVMFPLSFYINGAYLVTSYHNIYLYGSATVSGNSVSISGAYTSGASLISLSPNPASIFISTNSQSEQCQAFTVVSYFHRGCSNGNQANITVSTTFKALPSSYESVSTQIGYSQSGC